MNANNRWTWAFVAAALVLAGGAAATLAWHPALAAITPGKATFEPARIARGAELAAIGDCAVCHTAMNGATLAGGRGVPTPFGTVHATNITPDPATGIGRWSEAAFLRAMRDGIARDGGHLYPVLPYPHFTCATDADIGALYAFLMTRTPVEQAALPNALPFPLDQRITLAGWNLLFLRTGPWLPDPEHDALWNRGAYLAEAVGHCGACHTPHNPLGAEQDHDRYAGGQAENWPAPALQRDSAAPHAWTEDALAAYLATGFEAGHGAAAGPMTEVTEQLARVPQADISALAHYFAALMPQPAAPVAEPGPRGSAPDQATAALFEGACGSCHAADAPMTRDGAPSLALNTSVNAPGPDGVIQVILRGLPWREGHQAGFMPAFAPALTDAQVAGLAAYVRARYSARPAWTDLPTTVGKARDEGKN